MRSCANGCGSDIPAEADAQVRFCKTCRAEIIRASDREKSRRRLGGDRYRHGKRTESLASLGKKKIAAGRALYPEMPGIDYQRPRTRGDCVDGPRPCPFVSCRHHLYLEATPSGSVIYNFPDHDPDEIPQTCSLDVVDEGVTLAVVADALNLTREAARQIEERVFSKLRVAYPHMREHVPAGKVRLPVLDTEDEETPEAAE